jgi:hypothetical protein
MNVEKIIKNEIEKEVQDTVLTLCAWIKKTCNGQYSTDEIRALPEVIKATSDLYKTTAR